MTYNGWKNYETWAVALHLDNDQGTYLASREQAREILAGAPEHRNVPEVWSVEQAARFELADWLKDYAETLCGVGSESEDYGIPEPSLLASDLIRAALSEVDWEEIATNWLLALADDPTRGEYLTTSGNEPMHCTGDTSMVHGYPGERPDGPNYGCNCILCDA